MNRNEEDEKDFTECVEVRWSTAEALLPEGTAVRIRGGVLPMLLIPHVRVRTLVEKRLSSIELFMLRSVLKHKQLDLQDIENTTGIPSGPLLVLLNRLVHQGLLDRAAGGYAARNVTTERAVEAGTFTQQAESTMNVMYLPHTNDLVIPTEAGFRRLSKISALSLAPMPREQKGKPVKEILQEAAQRSGQDVEIIDVEHPSTLPALCPSFSFKGDLKHNDTNELWLCFPDAGNAAVDDHHYFNFSVAHRLVAALLSLSHRSPPEDQVRVGTSPDLRQDGRMVDLSYFKPDSPCRTTMTMPQIVISRIYPNHLLTTRAAMIVHWETPEAVVALEYSVYFQPINKQEAAAFARDRVLERIFANGSNPATSLVEGIKDACEEYGVEEDKVTKLNILVRLWNLKRFVLAYSLQSEGIFDYDKAI